MFQFDGPRGTPRRVGACALPLLVVLLAVPRPAPAQVWMGADATLATRYVWRGVTRVGSPVLQPSAYLAVGAGRGSLTAGGWWNVEIERATATDLTLAGAGSKGVGEVNVWLEYAARQATFDWHIGFWHYRVEQPATNDALAATLATSELYASASTLHTPIAVQVSGWLDVDRVSGAYYEAAVSHALGTHPLGEIVGSLFFGGRLGVSHGQAGEAGVTTDAFYFHSDGVVFYELFAQLAFEVPVSGAPLVINFLPRYELARDPGARRSSLDDSDADRARFFWMETSLSWRVQLGDSRRAR